VIPQGVEVLVPICLLNRDPDEWGTPIDKFDPDRFEGQCHASGHAHVSHPRH
jgi:cytochrome P450